MSYERMNECVAYLIFIGFIFHRNVIIDREKQKDETVKMFTISISWNMHFNQNIEQLL